MSPRGCEGYHFQWNLQQSRGLAIELRGNVSHSRGQCAFVLTEDREEGTLSSTVTELVHTAKKPDVKTCHTEKKHGHITVLPLSSPTHFRFPIQELCIQRFIDKVAHGDLEYLADAFQPLVVCLPMFV